MILQKCANVLYSEIKELKLKDNISLLDVLLSFKLKKTQKNKSVFFSYSIKKALHQIEKESQKEFLKRCFFHFKNDPEFKDVFFDYEEETECFFVTVSQKTLLEEMQKDEEGFLLKPLCITLPQKPVERIKEWLSVLNVIAKLLNMVLIIKEENIPSNAVCVFNEKIYANTQCIVETPFLKKETQTLFSVFSRLKNPILYRNNTYLDLKNPLFVLFYAHNLIRLVENEFTSFQKGSFLMEQEVYTCLHIESKDVSLIQKMYMYKASKCLLIQEAKLFVLFSMLIELCLLFIKWYDDSCVWEGLTKEKVLYRKRILKNLQDIIEEASVWVGFDIKNARWVK